MTVLAAAARRPGAETTTTVLWHVTMSLDGFIAGPDDAMDWLFDHARGPDAVIDELLASTGALVAGRRSYDVGRRDRARDPASGSAETYGGAWTGPEFVLTHHEPRDETDGAITFLSGDIGAAVATAAAAAHGKGVVIIGADVARQCVEADLLDEILVHVVPVLLGDGVRLFGGPGHERVALEPVGVEWSGQIADLRYRVLRRTS